jgi:hypothetical protein
VEAGQRLYRRSDRWRTADKALARLAERFPGFGPEETLLKVAAVNALYVTNVYAIRRTAEHVRSVMLQAGTAVADSGLVGRMAALPKTEAQRTNRGHYSFGSKFVHFFVDPERFPVYGSYAAAMSRYRLGRGGLAGDSRDPYRSFVANFRKLNTLAGFRMSTRDLDRYLWLAGQYREWIRRPTSATNTSCGAYLGTHPRGCRRPEAAVRVRTVGMRVGTAREVKPNRPRG